MKRLDLKTYATVFSMMFLFSGCSGLQSLVTIGTDKTLPVIQNVKVLVEKSSVGFEWPAIKDKRVKGINIYRALSSNGVNQKFTKIETLSGHYATHFVDRKIKANQRYLYMFTTYDLLHESPHGKILKVKTSSSYKAVEFVKVYLRASGVIKILWKPHTNPRIAGYVIQRRLAKEGGKWHYLASVPGRLMPEYIDSSVAKGHKYAYRVMARSKNGVLSQPSQEAAILVK